MSDKNIIRAEQIRVGKIIPLLFKLSHKDSKTLLKRYYKGENFFRLLREYQKLV